MPLLIERYSEGRVETSSDPAILPALLVDKNSKFWLDMESPTPEEFALLKDVFDFHPLAIEDAQNPIQRPKVDEYEGYAFFAVYAVRVKMELLVRPENKRHILPDADEMEDARQVSLFLGPNYLVSIETKPVDLIQELHGHCRQNYRIMDHGMDYLLYKLLDIIVDDYFPTLDALEERINDIEDSIIQRVHEGDLDLVFTLKHVLTRLRKHIGPLREVLQTLMTRSFPGVKNKTLPYLRDVADHVFRIYETLDLYRDLTSNLMDAYLSQKSNEMNETVRQLTVVTVVFMPLTFLTGFFGMNFEKMPWGHTNVFFWLGLMVTLVVGLLYAFHKRDWI